MNQAEAIPANVAERIMCAVGGPANIASLSRCWARLRFELVDPDVVDEETLRHMPEVAMALTQHGQFQIALRGGLLEVFDELTTRLQP